MATTYDKASLVMIPSGYKDDKLYSVKPTNGSGDFTFSRDGSGASPATRVNASGYIEKGRTNEILQSNDFNTTWYFSGVARTSGQSGYDGSNDAWEITRSGAFNYLAQDITTSGVQTFSTYAKRSSFDFLLIRFQRTASSYAGAYFDLASGVVGSTDGSGVIDSNIESVGGDWYRISITFNESLLRVLYYPVPSDGGVGTGGSGSVFIQDAQLESGLVATDVIETTTTAVSAGLLGDMPRLDYSGGATCPSLLLEPSRTNLATQSEYFDPVFSEASGVSWEENATTSPEGVVNAAKLNNSNASTQGAYYVSMSFTNNDTMVASIFAKAGTNNYLRFGISNQVESAHIYYNFNLAEGTFVFAATTGGMTNYSADIEDYGNGWYRCIVIGTFPSSGVTSGGVYPRIIGNGYLYLYGLQVEKNVSYPTSYIPTYGSASTRGVDDVNETTGFTSNIGQTEGTLFLDFVANDEDSLQIAFQVRTTGSTNVGQVDIRMQSGLLRALGTDAGVSQFNISAGAVIAGTRYKCAVRYKANDVAFYVNGSLAGVDTSASFSSSALQQIGFNENTGNFFPSASIKQALLFPTALTNAELAALTA